MKAWLSLALVLASCAADGGAHLRIPLGEGAKYGTLDMGYFPAPSLAIVEDAPRALALSDFKAVLKGDRP